MNHRLLICLLFVVAACNPDGKERPQVVFTASPFQKLGNTTRLQPDWSKSTTLVYQVMAEPPTLHPTNGNSSPWHELIQYLHAFLLNINFHEPGLAPGILTLPEISPDGLQYTYSLRRGARWDDGTPVTRDDIVFTLKASACPLTANSHVKAYWENLQAILPSAADSTSLTLVMQSTYIQNVELLAEVPVLQRRFFDPGNVLAKYSLDDFRSAAFESAPPADLEKWAQEFNDDRYGRDPRFLTGLGPYQLSRWETGQSLVLEKKPGYWNTEPSVHARALPEKIIFKLNRDDVSQKLEFRAQALDASSTVTIKTLLDLQQDSVFSRNYHAAVMPTYNYTYVAMNRKPDGTRRKLFDDVRARQAMARLIPVEELIRVVYKSYSPQCRRLAGPVSPMKRECDTTLGLVPHDAAEARRLLQEAGWKDTDEDGILDKVIDGNKVAFTPDLHIMNTTADWKDMAALVVASCRKAGIGVNVISFDPKVFIEKARAHDFDMMLGVWGGTSHAEDYTQLWHTSSWINHGNNYPGFGDAVSDALIDSIKVTLDEAARTGMVRRLQRMIYDDQPMVFLYSSLRRYIIHRRFHDVELYAERPGILLNNLKPVALQNEITP